MLLSESIGARATSSSPSKAPSNTSCRTVMHRGNDVVRQQFQDRLAAQLVRSRWELIFFVLMTNHFQLMVRIGYPATRKACGNSARLVRGAWRPGMGGRDMRRGWARAGSGIKRVRYRLPSFLSCPFSRRSLLSRPDRLPPQHAASPERALSHGPGHSAAQLAGRALGNTPKGRIPGEESPAR